MKISNRSSADRLKENKLLIWLFGLTALALLCATGLFGNGLITRAYSLSYTNLPPQMDGLTILSLADLHTHVFGENQRELIEAVNAQSPDLIILTGDVVDKRTTDIGPVCDLLSGISKTAPIYAISGNHEQSNLELFEALKALYREYDVQFMDGESVLFERDGAAIEIIGATILRNESGHFWADNSQHPQTVSRFSLLLDHYGDEFDDISDQYDLILTGHAHGGIVRIFGLGLFTNMGSLFPKYTRGAYTKNNGSTMVLSAGLGDSILPRFQNPRELVKVVLHASSSEEAVKS